LSSTLFHSSISNESKMKTSAKWAIGLGAGIPAALILI